MQRYAQRGGKLRQLRMVYDLTQKEFAQILRIPKGTLVSYENNTNPMPKKIIDRIFELIGLESEYFENERMDIKQALEKYKIDTKKSINEKEMLQIKDETCTLYYGLEAFALGKNHRLFELTNDVLALMFSGVVDFEPHFIKVKSNEAQPLAKNEDVLVVKKPEDKNYNNNDKLIIEFEKNVFIVNYKVSFDEILLQDISNLQEVKFSQEEFKEKVKVLGIIVCFYSLNF